MSSCNVATQRTLSHELASEVCSVFALDREYCVAEQHMCTFNLAKNARKFTAC